MSSESSNLNLLRAIAVLAVFVAHILSIRVDSARIWNLGHLGVLLFFVHTSLVLMLSLQRQDTSAGSDFRWLRFMVRRLFRVYPLSVIAVTLYVFGRIPSGFQFGQMTTEHLGKVSLLSNYLLIQNLTYSNSIPRPLWSLPFEMQMYLFLPALYVLANRVRTSRPLLWLWLAGVLFGLIQPHIPKAGRLSIAEYIPCFLPGVIAYFIVRQPSWKPRFRGVVWPLALLVPIIGFMFMPKGAALPKWIICLVVGLLIPLFAEISFPVVTKPAALIAKYSYGIYLFHPAAIWLVFEKFGFTYVPLGAVLAFGITFAISAGTFHFVERPLIRFGTKLASKRREPQHELAVAAGAQD